MRRTKHRAFTLVELLVVVLIIGILIALLMPGASTVMEMWRMTRCQSNLNTIWRAQTNWRADNEGRLLSGGGWMGRLVPYVEGGLNTFVDQDRIPTTYLQTDPIGDLTLVENPRAKPMAPQPAEVAFEFDVYKQNRTGVPANTRSTVYGALQWSIPLATHPWVRRTDQGNGVILYEIDDQGRTGNNPNPTYDDIKLKVYYDGLQPAKIEILQSQDMISTHSSLYAFLYDFKVNGEILVKDWVTQYLKNGGPVTYDLRNIQPANSSDDGLSGGTTTVSGGTTTYLVVIGDYGLNKGTYEVAVARPVTQVDAKLFFILDYGQIIADYNQDGQEDEWERFFILDPLAWQSDFGGSGAAWQNFQSLRHFGRTNVLFCDGHIESLRPEDLYPTDPRWWYRGR